MVNDTLANDEESQAQRRIILSAIILAIIVAAVLWYVFVLRQPKDEVAENLAPSPLVSVQGSPEGFAPFRDRTNGESSDSAGKVAARTATPTPQPVEPSAATGVGEFILAAASASVIGGSFGLLQIRRTKRQ